MGAVKRTHHTSVLKAQRALYFKKWCRARRIQPHNRFGNNTPEYFWSNRKEHKMHRLYPNDGSAIQLRKKIKEKKRRMASAFRRLTPAVNICIQGLDSWLRGLNAATECFQRLVIAMQEASERAKRFPVYRVIGDDVDLRAKTWEEYRNALGIESPSKEWINVPSTEEQENGRS